MFLIFGIFSNKKEKDEMSCFRSRAWFCYNIINDSSSYQNYIKKHTAVDWDQKPIFNEELKITIPENLNQYNYLINKRLMENEASPNNLVWTILGLLGLVIIYIFLLS